MSDRRKTKKDIHVTSEDETLEVNKHEHAAIFEGEAGNLQLSDNFASGCFSITAE